MYCGNCGDKLESKSKYCSECGGSTQETSTKIVKKDINFTKLNSRITALEKLGINNPSLIKRSFATYGYLIVSQLIVSGVILIILTFFGLFE